MEGKYYNWLCKKHNILKVFFPLINNSHNSTWCIIIYLCNTTHTHTHTFQKLRQGSWNMTHKQLHIWIFLLFIFNCFHIFPHNWHIDWILRRIWGVHSPLVFLRSQFLSPIISTFFNHRRTWEELAPRWVTPTLVLEFPRFRSELYILTTFPGNRRSSL